MDLSNGGVGYTRELPRVDGKSAERDDARYLPKMIEYLRWRNEAIVAMYKRRE